MATEGDVPKDGSSAPDLSQWINPEVGLIMGGGACRCAFSVGVFKAFAKRLGPEGGGPVPKERRLPGYIYGVSGNGLNGSEVVADGWYAGPMVAKWLLLEKLGSNWLFEYSYLKIGWRAFWNRPALYDNSNLRRLIHGDKQKSLTIPGLDVEAILNSPVRLDVPVTDETEAKDYDKEYVVFSNRDELVRKDPNLWRLIVQASASPPPVFVPVEIRGRMCSDPFYVKFKPAINSGAKTIFLVFNDCPEAPHSWTLQDWVERMITSDFRKQDKLTEMFLRYISELYHDLRIYRMGSPLLFVQRFDRKNEKPTPRFDSFGNKLLDIIIITPTKPNPKLGHLSFKPGAIKEAIAHGEERANEVLDALGW